MAEARFTAWSATDVELLSFKLDTPAQCHLCGRAPKWTLVVRVATQPTGRAVRADMLRPRMRAVGPLCVTPYVGQEEK